jgi:cell wall-associated NlpC family hydrolase
MKNLQNTFLTVAMAIGLAITGLTPAHASTPPTSVQRVTETVSIDAPIQANAKAALKYDQPRVSTAPATVVDAPAEIVQPAVKSESVSTVATTTVAKAATPAVSPAPVPAPVAPAAPSLPITHSFSGGAVVAAALAQLGVEQDCTALVTRSIAAVGINFHGWPAGYLSLGHTVPASAAQPGDLAYYENGGMGVPHIAVYVGNGMAVHGGWNGGITALASVNIGSGPVFIRLG